MSSYISGIRYELGDCVPITAEALQCSEELVEAFRADGQTTFRRSEDVGSQLAAVPARARNTSQEAAWVRVSADPAWGWYDRRLRTDGVDVPYAMRAAAHPANHHLCGVEPCHQQLSASRSAAKSSSCLQAASPSYSWSRPWRSM